MVEIRQTPEYEHWFGALQDRMAKAKIDIRIRRLSLGNPGDVAPIGEGLSELKVDHGPGYRVYFMQHRGSYVLLLAGGDKASQVKDIRKAKELASRYLERIMAKATMRPWDPAEHLQSGEDMAAYLEAALQDGDPALVAAALGDIAKAKGMTQLARDTGLGRESLYKALSPSGNPEFATVLRVVGALGLQLHAAPVASVSSNPSIERTCQGPLRAPCPAAHVKR